jgi:hypothetical protein
VLSDIDFDNQHNLQDFASRILKAIRAEANGSAARHRKLLLHNLRDDVAVIPNELTQKEETQRFIDRAASPSAAFSKG